MNFILYITGDTHGEQPRFTLIEKDIKLTANDYLIICGDFGFISFDEDKQRFLDDLEQRPYTICFIDGNHENFAALNSYSVEEWNGGIVHRIRKNIVHLMRGQVFNIEGKKIFTMGGAYSRDRYRRELGVSYWKEEIPSNEEYAQAVKNLKAVNNSVDFIVTHTAPKEMLLRMKIIPDEYDIELTGFLEYLMYEINYSHWYCGHLHQDKDIGDKFSVLWFDVRALK